MAGGRGGGGARAAAERLLARRDHGRRELRTKLLRKGFESAEVEEVLNALQARGLLDDAAYARALARAELSRGHGPAYIAAKLRARGVTENPGEVSREAQEASLRALLDHRGIGPGELTDARERAKIWRFLRGRGYAGSVISAVLGSLEEED